MSFPFCITIGGEAGYGIMSAGIMLSKIATRSGYQTFTYSEYPSIIRGGHNVTTIAVAAERIYSQYRPINLLIALNQETVDKHVMDVVAEGIVLCDADSTITVPASDKHFQLVRVPLNRLAKDIGGSIIMRNSVALGAAVALLGADIQILHELIRQEFGEKKPEMALENIKTSDAGFAYITEKYSAAITKQLIRQSGEVYPMVVNGNESIALGAIAGGMQFTAIYPMTPTSNILHVLAPLQEQYHFVYEQPEDEIAAITMAIGASFAGARAMVATAGGGFCLMSEGYGLAGMTETPLVIIMGMRGGPATGLPTWTEQGDLRFVLHAHQGDFPRIVLAASDQSDAFTLTQKAFYLADKYQTPVLVLVDKYICESTASVPPFTYDESVLDRGKIVTKKQKTYERYALSTDGISPRAFPGSGNYMIGNSDEHNPRGYSEESSDNRIAQMDKRAAKLTTCAREDMEAPTLYGPKNARITLVSWGSTRGPILEAIKKYSTVNYLHITWMNPFPADAVKKILQNAKHLIDIECNSTGELAGLIREHTGIHIEDVMLKYDGRPLYPEEIGEKIEGVKKKKRFFSFG